MGNGDVVMVSSLLLNDCLCISLIAKSHLRYEPHLYDMFKMHCFMPKRLIVSQAIPCRYQVLVPRTLRVYGRSAYSSFNNKDIFDARGIIFIVIGRL